MRPTPTHSLKSDVLVYGSITVDYTAALSRLGLLESSVVDVPKHLLLPQNWWVRPTSSHSLEIAVLIYGSITVDYTVTFS